MYIQAASSISTQNSYENQGFSSNLFVLENSDQLIHPDYKSLIDPIHRRRMSEVLKMSASCTRDCISQLDEKGLDAVIIGTSNGSAFHSQKFLDNIIRSEGKLISPTSFTLSTHNTIAGQISLMTGNQNYNITHTQSSLSFEHALLDAKLGLLEGFDQVLVGNADETENKLFDLKRRLGRQNIKVRSGCSYFIISRQRKRSNILLKDIYVYAGLNDLKMTILGFLADNKLAAHELDKVLFSYSEEETKEVLTDLWGADTLIDFQQYSGHYLSNSGFAMHLASDMLKQDQRCSNILICNNLIPDALGLVLLTKEKI